MPDTTAVSSAGNTVALFIQTPSGDGIDRKQQEEKKKNPNENHSQWISAMKLQALAGNSSGQST